MDGWDCHPHTYMHEMHKNTTHRSPATRRSSSCAASITVASPAAPPGGQRPVCCYIVWAGVSLGGGRSHQPRGDRPMGVGAVWRADSTHPQPHVYTSRTWIRISAASAAASARPRSPWLVTAARTAAASAVGLFADRCTGVVG